MTSTPKKKKKPPKQNLASTYFTSPSTTVQQIVDNQLTATNPLIQSLISSRPTGATRVMADPHVSTDTVYFTLRVTLPVRNDNGIRYRDYYDLEVHFHPRPTTANFLHVKRTAGSDAGNVLGVTNWLIDSATLQAGRAAWNLANPSRLATH